MGNLDRLLEALARKLPSTADRPSLVAALQEAAKALPESQSKTRSKLSRNEEACVEKLEALLSEVAVEAADEPAVEAIEVDEVGKADAAVAAYVGIEDDHRACVARCAELLQAALVGLRPAHFAEQAIEGLVAILPAGAVGFDMDSLLQCLQLVPSGQAAFACSESPVWSRFLGFLLTAIVRLKDTRRNEPTQKDAKDVAVQVGSLIALSTQPAPARSALRQSLSVLDEQPRAGTLACLASGVLPVLHIAFGGIDTFKNAALVQSDLTALLHCLRFVGMCRKAGVGEARALSEACDLLRVALERHFEAAVLLPELQHAGILPAKRRRLAKGSTDAGRASAAKCVAEAVIAASDRMDVATIKRIVNVSGLPVGDDEGTDRQAAAARARGDLFFEDVSGGVEAEASAKAAANVLLQLDGVENLKPKKKKKRTAVATEVEAD